MGCYTTFIVLQCNQNVSMANMVSVGGFMLCSVFLFFFFFFFGGGGVLVDEMHINMDKLITCI